MLKEWFWWQIEASMEGLDDEGSVSLSQSTLFLWMALALKRWVEHFPPQHSTMALCPNA